jgi:hypothetical protein
MRLNSEQRRLIGVSIKFGIKINLLAKTFSCSRQTIWYWKNQDLRTRFNLPKNVFGKISVDVEIAILNMRMKFKWGTARIQQGLINLPDFMLNEIEVCVQNFNLSRQAINCVLKKHKLNGYYRRKNKSWKFFRAKFVNELWQIDLKEFKFEGKKYYIFVVVDDYSRYILCLELFDHCPTTNELISVLQKLNVKPKKILSDNGNQFKEQWKKWCLENKIESIFAHPYYPQDKGKVERTIRNLAEEFVNLILVFHQWLNIGSLEKWRCWFNEKRFHRGIKDYPSNIYVKL